MLLLIDPCLVFCLFSPKVIKTNAKQKTGALYNTSVLMQSGQERKAFRGHLMCEITLYFLSRRQEKFSHSLDNCLQQKLPGETHHVGNAKKQIKCVVCALCRVYTFSHLCGLLMDWQSLQGVSRLKRKAYTISVFPDYPFCHFWF